MKKFDQINMIPFIDIMLVLLAIVLTTASFVAKGLIEIDLPQTEYAIAQTSHNEEFVEISINATNEIFYQGESKTLYDLELSLSSLPKDTLIILRIDKASLFDYFIQVINLLKAHEFDRLNIEAEQSE